MLSVKSFVLLFVSLPSESAMNANARVSDIDSQQSVCRVHNHEALTHHLFAPRLVPKDANQL